MSCHPSPLLPSGDHSPPPSPDAFMDNLRPPRRHFTFSELLNEGNNTFKTYARASMATGTLGSSCQNERLFLIAASLNPRWPSLVTQSGCSGLPSHALTELLLGTQVCPVPGSVPSDCLSPWTSPGSGHSSNSFSALARRDCPKSWEALNQGLLQGRKSIV